MTEWPGRWQQGVERYRAGEQYLLLLADVKGVVSVAEGESGRWKITNGMVSVTPQKAERAMRLQKTLSGQGSQIPYREVADAIRAALREQP